MPRHAFPTHVVRTAALLATILLGTSGGLAAVIHVDADATGAGNGTSWADAFGDLQAALAVAVTNVDQIWVAEGTYVPGSSTTDTFMLVDGVAVYGGFAGTETALGDRNPDPFTNGTVLSGDIGVTGVATDNIETIVTGPADIGSGTILDGFTIRDAFGTAGGGLHLNGASGGGAETPVVRNCLFTQNTADDGGAVLLEVGVDATFDRCTFLGNSATEGGAVWATSNAATVFRDCLFEGNGAVRGGAVYATGCNLQFVQCLFDANAADRGGAYYVQASNDSPTMTNCAFVGNTASDAGSGGGIDLRSNNNAVITIANCVFWGNTTAGAGGEGGQIGDNLSLSDRNQFTIRYCLVEGWTGALAGTNPASVGNSGADPLFVDEASGDYHLQAGSAAIDAGDNAAGGLTSLDYDGNPRFVDDPNVADTGAGTPPIVDIGLFEFDGSVDCNGNGVPDDEDILMGTSQDCNGNGIPDECDITAGTSLDCNTDGVPDECQTDCDGNGVPDDCDIAGGAPDCNGNGVPDGCDIALGTSLDCNTDGVPDECQADCNGNGVPDDCDITAGTSEDCNTNGVPDECESLDDCNGNGIPDICDIADGTSEDCDANGVPDECDTDCNGNGIPDGCDISSGTSIDCNANGLPDECEGALVTVDGYAPGSPTAAFTTGLDGADLPVTAIFTGTGFVDGAEGMVVTFVTVDETIVVDPALVTAASGGTELMVVVPAVSPGCDCADGLPLFADVLFDNGCDETSLSASGVALWQYDISSVPVLDAAGLQAAVDAARPGDCLLLQAGTRYLGEVVVGGLVDRFTITSTDPTTPAATSIEGQYVGAGPPPAPAITFSGTPSGVCLRGVNLMLGNGGAELIDASPTIVECKLDDNFADASRAGGVTISGTSAPVLADCDILFNTTDGDGGGIRVVGASATEPASGTIVNCRIVGNRATGQGGGVYLQDTAPDLLIADCDVSFSPYQAETVTDGGGIHWVGTDLTAPAEGTLLRTDVWNNTATGNGAGISLGLFARPVLARNCIGLNVAGSETSAGGGIHVTAFNREDIVICENIVFGNEAQVGGAIALRNKNEALVQRNLILCNTVTQHFECEGTECPEPPPYYAPGIHVLDAGVQILHNTLFANTYDGGGPVGPLSQGGGIHGEAMAAGLPRLWDNLLQDNTGWEIYTDIPLHDDVVDGNLGFESGGGAQDIINPLFINPGALNIEGLDPLLANPQCASCDPSVPEEDLFADFTPLPGSPALGAATDGQDIGAVVASPYAPGDCSVPVVSPDCNGNGVPDGVDILAGLATDANGNGTPDACETSWIDEGCGLAGSLGIPQLEGLGQLLGGQIVTLSVSSAAPSAPSWNVTGFSLLEAPFKGGILVPNPDLILGGFVTSPSGTITFPFAWPTGIPAGFVFWTQFWISDASGPVGFSATNALQGVAAGD